MRTDSRRKDEALNRAAEEYCKSVNDDCLCQRTVPGTPVGEHIYCFCGCDIHKAYLCGYSHRDAQVEKLVQASENLLRNFARDWYCEMFARCEKPTPTTSGAIAKAHNKELSQRIGICIEELRKALREFRGEG